MLLETVCVSPYFLVSGPEPVTDDKLTASSTWSMVGKRYHGPSEARLDNLPDLDGVGAWNPANANINEYIQVLLLVKKGTTFIHYTTAALGYKQPNNQ